MSEDIVLIKVDKATELLRDAENLSTPKDLRALAKGAISILKARRDSTLESINHAAEIKIRCERRIGQLLKEQPKAKGGTPYKKSTADKRSAVETLAEKGLTEKESSRFQKVADVSDEEFESVIAGTKEKGGELSTQTVLGIEKEKKQKYRWIKCPTCGGTGKIKKGEQQ